MRIQLEQIDLLRPWPTLALREGYHALRVLVRIGDTPVGEVMSRPVRGQRELPPRRLRRRIARKLSVPLLQALARHAADCGPDALTQLAAEAPESLAAVTLTTVPRALRVRLIEKHLLHETGLPAPWAEIIAGARAKLPSFPMPPITVVVCTRDRADQLARCVRCLMATAYPDFEILIVDNSVHPEPTRLVCEQLGVSYAREARPGLSRARNAALAAARHRWIAFTDDDCLPEPGWLTEMVRKLQDTNCRAVCGLVLPAQLENSAEIAFEIYGGLGRGFGDLAFEPNVVRARRWRPAETWRFGAGACMLIDGDLARDLGGFDLDLGAGTPCGCSEDTLLWYQMLRRGHSIHYAPRAVVHHYHRSSPEALRHQIFNYASGHAAYHVRCFASYGDHRSLLHLLYHLPTWFWRNYRRAARGKTRYPRTLIPIEVRGTLHGMVTYPWLKLRRGLADLFGRARTADTPAAASAAPAGGRTLAVAAERLRPAPPARDGRRALETPDPISQGDDFDYGPAADQEPVRAA